MPAHSIAQRLLPHLRRVAVGRDANAGDGELLGAFIANHDGDSFATLVRRHGPMVLGVCKRVIGDVHLAEDAFQATLLVLARRAADVRPRHLVGNWLYGVAFRTALKARGVAARRNAKEKQVDAMPHPTISPEEAWADLQPILDSELTNLPEKYRVPIVLCDLGGRPQRQVARELKIPPATLANRLARARRLLAKRLTDRGVSLSIAAVASALGWHGATSAVSPALTMTTVQAACAVAAGGTAGLPAPVVELSEGVMRMFVINKLKTIAAGVATCLALLTGLVSIADPVLRANPQDPPTGPPSKSTPPTSTKSKPSVESDDAQFLRRTSLDLRGKLPTLIEMNYFIADKDAKKRSKIVEWMLPKHGKQPVTANCASCHSSLTINVQGLLECVHQKSPPTATEYAEYVKRVIGLPAAEKNHDVDRARIDVEQAKVAVATVQSNLNALEADAKSGKHDQADFKARVDQARMNLHEAQAQLNQAEARLALAEQAAKARQISNQAGEDGWSTRQKFMNDFDQRVADFRASAMKAETTDLDFLRRLSLDIRGVPPTRVEENYFQADKDPEKREKMLQLMLRQSQGVSTREKFVNELLTDPKVQERWVELWKERMEKESRRAIMEEWIRESSDRLSGLLREMLDATKSDAQILDALCLATMSRFPTETERKVILDGVKSQSDHRAAWNSVLRALALTSEAKAHAAALARRSAK